MKYLWILMTAVASLAMAHELTVQDAWIRLLPGSTTSAYMTLVNPAAKTPAQIVGASSPAAAKVTLHTTMEMSGGNAEMTTMKPLTSVTVPPKGKVMFKPGGMHLMLEGLKAPLKVGQKIKIVLKYSDGDTQTVIFTVRNQ
ncbi:MAG: copper chaperone PCu(A)C [Thermaceae bacterium]|nr:copper chaperone PCu(A)C [Thermaceae bacterium]